MITHTTFLQVVVIIEMLLIPFFLIVLVIFVVLLNFSHRIFTKRIGSRMGELDFIDKSIIWIMSVFVSLAVVTVILYAAFEWLSAADL
jgi:hypothetical protein